MDLNQKIQSLESKVKEQEKTIKSMKSDIQKLKDWFNNSPLLVISEEQYDELISKLDKMAENGKTPNDIRELLE